MEPEHYNNALTAETGRRSSLKRAERQSAEERSALARYAARASLPDTFFYKCEMKEKRTHLGDGGEEENTRSSVQTEKLHLFGGRSQWMHLVYSG